jgi:peroxiredoxin
MTDDEARLSADLTARALPPGASAPAFTLETAPGQTVSLDQFTGRPVVLAFYPGDWTPVCNDQLVELSAHLDDFARRGATLLAISVDSAWSHAAFAEARHLRLPLLADFHPKGDVSRAYGVWSEEWGTSQRALFVLDGAGVVRWRLVVPAWVNPGMEDVLRALAAVSVAAP